jgi:tetratricopeptide (TPR) repeat protein
MKNMLLIVFLLLLLRGTVFAITPENQFQTANQLYLKKEYAAALAMYDSLIHKGFSASNLFYNAGNAAFKTKDMGHAVLYLEKARLFNPNDEDILFNLKLVNLKLVDQIDPIPQLFFVTWWNNYLNWLSPTAWIIMALICLFLFALCFGYYYLRASSLVLIRMLSFVFLIFGGLFWFTAVKSHSHLFHLNYGVVMPSNITVKAAPDAASVDLFPLHEGLKVQLKEVVQGWQKIRIEDGKEGWVNKECIEGI